MATKKNIKVRDLKPRKDAKGGAGGFTQGTHSTQGMGSTQGANSTQGIGGVQSGGTVQGGRTSTDNTFGGK
jgi:hypothetical protein